MMRLGCIGIGSNAIRLLTSSWDGQHLTEIRRERMGTRLFAGLQNGILSKESIDVSVHAVKELACIAQDEDVKALFVFATSAVRDAVNAAEFTQPCEDLCGSPVEIISGEEEACLSYLGASDGGSCGVIDIGGGSTEFTLGTDDRIEGAVSLQIGAVRMNAQHPILSVRDYKATVSRCSEIILSGADRLLLLPPKDKWIGVGGTMTTLGSMEKQIPLFTESTCEGMVVSYDQVAYWGKHLSGLQLIARRYVPGLMPHRADIIPNGIAILDAAMQCFGMDEIALSAHGNMDGYLKRKFRQMQENP